MKPVRLLAMAALVLTAGAASAETMSTVVCEDIKVTIDEKQTMEIKAVTGEENFARDVCAVIGDIDTSNLSDPMDVDMTLSNGNMYKVTLEAAE
ncbi:hypothetical protein [Tropicimonas sediminicola]|uniref:Uncharacterized protein n=1 Tax=Tropicimonas sediminicola TaxID=1031541 RepID=A0A239F2M3_9RHOB|nr:hypothetical protein [Tropicimonas sediminicola]SNS51085.1 hypothetical protein SAMN05421757_102462 [Tropicimonas sediminicola]